MAPAALGLALAFVQMLAWQYVEVPLLVLLPFTMGLSTPMSSTPVKLYRALIGYNAYLVRNFFTTDMYFPVSILDKLFVYFFTLFRRFGVLK